MSTFIRELPSDALTRARFKGVISINMFEVTCGISESDIQPLMKTGSIACFPNEDIDSRALSLSSFVATDSLETAAKRFRHVFGKSIMIDKLEIKPIINGDIQSKDWLVHAMYEKAIEGEIDGRIEFSL